MDGPQSYHKHRPYTLQPIHHPHPHSPPSLEPGRQAGHATLQPIHHPHLHSVRPRPSIAPSPLSNPSITPIPTLLGISRTYLVERVGGPHEQDLPLEEVVV